MAKEIVEALTDFGGGLNTLLAPNQLKPNQGPTLRNVYGYNGALTKRAGSTAATMTVDTVGATGSQFIGFEMLNTFLSVLGSVQELLLILGFSGAYYTSAKWTADGSTFYDLAETAGTVTTTSGSAVVTGSGTSWATRVKAGDLFKAGSSARFIIQSVDSDTQITLTQNFTATGAAQSYSILMAFGQLTTTTRLKSRIRMIPFNGKIYFVSSYGLATTARSWVGHASLPSGQLGLVSAFPNVKFVTAHKNYIFGANIEATPSRVRWSALKDAETWSASNFIDVNPDDGQEIVGMFSDGVGIVILKRSSAYYLAGDIFDPSNPTYQLTKISTPHDFFADNSRSATVVNGIWVFSGAFGLYQWNGDKITKLEDSNIINSIWSSFTSPAFEKTPTYVTSTSNHPLCMTVESSGINYNGDYWTIRNQDADGYPAIVVRDRNGAYWRWGGDGGMSVRAMSYFLGSLYGVEGVSGQRLLKLDTGYVDVGSALIDGTWTSKVLRFANQQQFSWVHVYFKKQAAGSLTFEYSIDEGSFVSSTIDMTTGAGTRVKSQRIIIGRVGQSLQFRLSNSTADQNFEVYGIEFGRRNLRI